MMARPGRELAVAHPAQHPAERLLADRDAELGKDPLRQSLPRRRPGSISRQRTIPSTAGLGPASTIRFKASRCSRFKRGRWPDALPSIRPAGPCALNAATQSRTVCRCTPPISAAALREAPS
jgi:hypothetical protein